MIAWIFFLLFFVLLIFYPLFLYWNYKLQEKNILIFKFGKMGCGKTSDIIKQSQKDLRSGEWTKVYTTVQSPGCYLFNPQDVGKYTFEPNSSIYIDEVGMLYDSRKFSTFPDYVRDWFKFMRQYKCKVTLYSQAPDIDKKLRDLAHEYHLLSRWFVFTVDWLVYKKLDVGTDADGNGKLTETYQKGSILDMRLNYLPRYVGLFESYNPPQLPLIRSRYIEENEMSIRSSKFRIWQHFNLRNVYKLYNSVCLRLSQAKQKLLSFLHVPDGKSLKSYFFHKKKSD